MLYYNCQRLFIAIIVAAIGFVVFYCWPNSPYPYCSLFKIFNVHFFIYRKVELHRVH